MLVVMDDPLLVSELFARAGVVPRDGALTEKDFVSVCAGCGTEQGLDQASLGMGESVGMVTAYRCGSCGEVLLETGHWGFVTEGRLATRLGDYAVYAVRGFGLRR